MREPKRWERYTLDVSAWWIGLALAALLRYDFQIPRIPWLAVFLLVVAASVLQLLSGHFLRVYRGRHVWGSFESVVNVTVSTILVAVPLWLYSFTLASFSGLSRSLVPIALPIVLVLMLAYRYLWRMGIEAHSRPGEDAAPVIIFGAGYVGSSLVKRLVTDTNSLYDPVAFLDDDREKKDLKLSGVPVRGALADLCEVKKRTGATHLVVALGDPAPEVLQKVGKAARDCNLQVMLMPPIDELLREGIKENRLRDLQVEDLLGRSAVSTNVSDIAQYLNGKKVLVTGAGGSIGSQLCVEINKHGPSQLIMLDRDETGLQQAEISISGHGLLNDRSVVLADIRDRETIGRIFEEHQPEVVFHAAALKHLPLLEQYPEEAWRTNVQGTLNVLEAAENVGVETFVNVSTDKAANPVSVLGYSKLIAERLTAWKSADRPNETGDRRYLSVRFGNVIGSRGSMLPTFQRLIEEGRPLTVTHPDATRYFMTIPEACQLVLQAGGIGEPGEVLILDMGEPVRILDVAEQMISLSGKDVEIVFTGLREGEKLDEELYAEHEVAHRPHHPLVSHADVPQMPASSLDLSEFLSWAQTPKEQRKVR